MTNLMPQHVIVVSTPVAEGHADYEPGSTWARAFRMDTMEIRRGNLADEIERNWRYGVKAIQARMAHEGLPPAELSEITTTFELR